MSAAAWLLLFPAARDSAAAGIGRLRARLATIGSRVQARASIRAHDSSPSVRHAGARAWRGFSRHRALLVGGALLLVLPPLLVLQLRQKPELESYEATELAVSNPQILELLRGERLVPPPELPPEVFVAAEAVLLEMGPAAVAPERIVSADRKWDRIDAAFQQRVLAVYQVMREQYGYEMVLVEGYRSPQRQAELARKGRGTTRAGAGQSCHQYGLAVDSAPLRDGKLQWDMQDPWTRRGYFLYGELAQQAGLEWGGAWRSLKDYVHLESKHACRAARRAARAG
ncbi:M15 family metallopeptidase [Lysobacter koreensis]|uniref:M15 family metallopeptidase n=1 Tax=Lysobacter koreensis TaxID=266122 RepID=A0ABW2YSV0_9GAMM